MYSTASIYLIIQLSRPVYKASLKVKVIFDKYLYQLQISSQLSEKPPAPKGE